MSVAFILALAAAAASQPDDLSVQAVHNFGACIVRQTPRGAEETLALDFRTDDYRKKLRAVVSGHSRCLLARWDLGSSGVLIAGAMAEALLESEVKKADLPKRIAFDPARPPIEARDTLEDMALCTALHGSKATADLFKTEPASRQEKQAMEALAPFLTQCLKSNTVANLNRPALRSLLALAAWRIVSTPANTLAETAK